MSIHFEHTSEMIIIIFFKNGHPNKIDEWSMHQYWKLHDIAILLHFIFFIQKNIVAKISLPATLPNYIIHYNMPLQTGQTRQANKKNRRMLSLKSSCC